MKKFLLIFTFAIGNIALANTSEESSNMKLELFIVNDCCENAEILQDYLTIVLGVSQEAANKAQVLYYDECIQNQ